jgi:tetratricopeptide (TPR) repeat protein
MQDTLCLFDELLTRGRRLQQAGQATAAVVCLERLLALAGVPGLCAAEAHQRLGEIALKRRLFRRARRHLLSAIRLWSENPRAHFLLGLAWSQDPEGDAHKAARHYRRALKLSPQLARCRGELGLVLLRLGEPEEGLELLREAAEQAAGDAGAAGRLVKGLLLCGRPDEAMAAVRAALFRAPRCARLRKLWIDLQLAALRRDRETSAASQREPGAVVLPFLRPVAETTVEGAARHAGHALAGPHLVRLRAPARGWRRAP